MKTLEGALVAQNMKVALVAARFNEFITAKLHRRGPGRTQAPWGPGRGHPPGLGPRRL